MNSAGNILVSNGEDLIMITLNSRYLINVNEIADKIEKDGFTVCIINEQDVMYEDDLGREFRQNLSAHDWETEAEWRIMMRYIKYDKF